MYLRVKRKNTTTLLHVEPSDSFQLVKQRIASLFSIESHKVMLLGSDKTKELIDLGTVSDQGIQIDYETCEHLVLYMFLQHTNVIFSLSDRVEKWRCDICCIYEKWRNIWRYRCHWFSTIWRNRPRFYCLAGRTVLLANCLHVVSFREFSWWSLNHLLMSFDTLHV